ncbi:AraC family transcriptional regulator [Salibacterium salarium]|uniref:AraC family transcriptional regulator n=1 Tax=Salibacterium salarium TaxID=284579 RepID=A0A428N3T4_9BACI|nr:AraC family transcriptional regulator [Salibacterium salarium]RSL33115.1 AraC family transcriptional regulator [Salibacterium salarium]
MHSDINQDPKLFNELHQTYFRIHRIDQNVRPPKWQIDKTDRPYTVFWYVAGGEKTVKINDVPYHVTEGSLVVFPSQVPFEIIKSEETTLDHFEIALENRLGPFNLMSLYKFPIVTKLSNVPERERLINLWQQLLQEWTPEKRNPFTPENGELQFDLNQTIRLLTFNALTLNWLVTVLTLLQPHAEELVPTVDSRFQQLFYFINDHLADKLTLKTLADEIYLSESHLSLLFRQQLKIAPMEFVRTMRMQKAREMLLTTSVPLKQIAEKIGFDDQSQLSRAFRQTVGVSPAEYRRKGDYI